MVGCWHGYLSGAQCRLAYGPADATATHCLASLKSILVLPFWYRLTRVVPDKGPLKVCVRACVRACMCLLTEDVERFKMQFVLFFSVALRSTYFEIILLSDDLTRVKLRGSNGDYINANFVNVRKKHFLVEVVLSLTCICACVLCIKCLTGPPTARYCNALSFP